MSESTSPKRLRPHHAWLGAAVLGVALALFAGGLFEKSPTPEWPGVMVFEKPHRLQPFELIDHKGDKFNLERFRDRWTFLFFGYTHCPDFCPSTLAAMKRIYAALTETPRDIPVQFVYVSVDPFRDTQSVMAEHIYFYNPEFIGVTAKDETAVRQLTEQLGVSYDYEHPETGDRITDPRTLPPEFPYIVNHYGSLFLVDPDASVRADILPPYQVARVTEIFATLSSH